MVCDTKVCKTVSSKSITRGVIVVDAGLEELCSELQDMNFIMVSTDQSLLETDRKIKRMILSGRILITSTPDAFEWDASSFVIKIIDIRAVMELTHKEQAELISKAITIYKIQNLRHGLLITLNPNEEHGCKDLID